MRIQGLKQAFDRQIRKEPEIKGGQRVGEGRLRRRGRDFSRRAASLLLPNYFLNLHLTGFVYQPRIHSWTEVQRTFGLVARYILYEMALPFSSSALHLGLLIQLNRYH